MCSVFDVAQYLLEINGGEMTAIRLQKMCYYSQAWSLVWDEQPLFSEKIGAWINGPVVRELYDVHKGKFMVKAYDFAKGDISKLTEGQKETVQNVFSFYKGYNLQQLSDLTYFEDPWKNARKRIISGREQYEVAITHSDLIEYYSNLC